MSDELRHLEISTPTRTHVPELEQFAINQKPKSSDHRDLRLYRYGVSSLYQWWSKRDGSVFEDPCDEPFFITARAQGPGPTAPALEVMVTTDDEGTTLVVLMEKLSGAQIAMSDAVFREMVSLVMAALDSGEMEDVPDEAVIRLH